jgi:hypothetical protein
MKELNHGSSLRTGSKPSALCTRWGGAFLCDYLFVSSQAATFFVLLCIPFFAATILYHRKQVVEAMWGTVENLAASSSQTRDVPAGGCIYIATGEVRPREVFITFGGPQGHDDRLTTCGRLSIGQLTLTSDTAAACRHADRLSTSGRSLIG